MEASSYKIPFLQSTNGSKQLHVHGSAFLMRAAELQNSSLSSPQHMSDIWPKLLEMNINTVLGCVTWEMIEPREDNFDFSRLDEIILDARNAGLKLVLLWFGSFKNALSTYAPSWVKLDTERFPRAELSTSDKQRKLADAVSTFSDNGVEADAKAFGKFMKHLKEVDEKHSTVIMVQVENEPGLLGDSRDRSEAAEALFSAPVPSDLLRFLEEEWQCLHADMRFELSRSWWPNCRCTNTSWESVFGAGHYTDELFMAYHFAKYTNQVAHVGKTAYALPLFTNFWLNYASNSDTNVPAIAGGGGAPGDYPSGGAVSKVVDVWMKFAPSLDFIAPDIYLNDYNSTCATYRHRNQALFIPEQRRDEYGARRIWKAIGTYNALGASPFGIDTLEPENCAFTKHYGLLKSVERIVLDAQQRPGSMFGFYFDEPDAEQQAFVETEMDGFSISITRSFVFGKATAGSGLIINIPSDGPSSNNTSSHQSRFLLVGWGFQCSFKCTRTPTRFTGILKFTEQEVDPRTGELNDLRWLNGDETGSGSCVRMPSSDPDYGDFPISITVPAKTGIAKCEMYGLKA